MDMLKRLSVFHVDLRGYQDYRIKQADEGLTEEEVREMLILREKLVGERGALESLITELTGKSTIQTIGKGPEYSYNMWGAALKRVLDSHAANALDICIDTVNRALRRFESDLELGIRDTEGKPIEKSVGEDPPKAFIAHGGETPSLVKLRSFLIALGIEPLIVEDQPSRGRSIGENVDWYARGADFAIILATKGDRDAKTGSFIPRGNVLIEIGKAQEIFPDRIIYLLQAGTKFPSNINEKVWVRFAPQSMDDSFIRIALELREFGILKAIKPPPKE